MDFPIETLPPAMRDAIEAQAAMGNYHLASVGTAALSIASLAAQSLYNVDFLALPRSCPVSLYTLIIAPSGGAKSTLFAKLETGVKNWQRNAARAHKQAMMEYDVQRRFYERDRVQAEKSGTAADLLDIERRKPLRPRSPWNVSSKTTTNGLIRMLHEEWPSHGLFSAEAASLLKGHSLNAKNSPEEFGGTIASLWSGESIDRATGDARMMLHDRRLSILLLAQGGVASDFLGSQALEEQGALARFLIVQAPPWKPIDHDFTTVDHEERTARLERRMERFHDRIERLLSHPLDTRENSADDGELELPTLGWTPEAKRVMREFQTEALSWHGETENWFRRAFEHCLRLSAVLAIFEGEEAISADCARAGVALTRFYAHERRSLEIVAIDDRHSQYEKYITAAMKRFREAPEGLTLRDLSRSIWKRMDAPVREKVIEAMIKDDLIAAFEVQRGKNKTVIYKVKENENGNA